MSDEGEPFPGELFPSSYLVVYCPLKSCPLEEPFKEACNLLEHLKFSHNILIHNSAAVLPFLDRYLTALAENKRFDNLDKASIITIGSNDPEDCLVRDQLQQKVLVPIKPFYLTFVIDSLAERNFRDSKKRKTLNT